MQPLSTGEFFHLKEHIVVKLAFAFKNNKDYKRNIINTSLELNFIRFMSQS